MGLAASQARFLGITARKNNCELRAIAIAQEKLSISNQLAQLSQNYYHSLDATKLVWDSDAAGNGSVYDLSYDLLMNPNAINNYYPQVLTNRRNQVILNDKLYNALKDVQFRAEGSNNNGDLTTFAEGGIARTAENYQKFVNAILGISNYLQAISTTDNNGNTIVRTTDSENHSLYRPDNGIGGFVQEHNTANAMDKQSLIEYINDLVNSNDVSGETDYMKSLREFYSENNDIYTTALSMRDSLIFSKADCLPPALGSNNYNANISKNEFTLKDLLNGNVEYTMSYTGSNTACDAKRYEALAKILGIEGSIASDGNISNVVLKYEGHTYDASLEKYRMDSDTNQVVDVPPGPPTGFAGIFANFFIFDSNSDSRYLIKALKDTYQLFLATEETKDSPSTRLCTTYCESGRGSNTTSTYKFSLSNMFKSAMTYYEKMQNPNSSGYEINSTTHKISDSYLVTEDLNFMYGVKRAGSLNLEETPVDLVNDFYSQLFNQICVNGFDYNVLAQDKSSLKTMLQNGSMFLATLGNDGIFYQRPYNNSGYIVEVKDEDAIARAEAEYKIQQAKLSAKEEELNIDKQSIDAELSALTTEYDTVKSLIGKSVEKGFSTCGD